MCPPARRALEGVYHPARLRVIDLCRAVAGRVALINHEEEGDDRHELGRRFGHARRLDDRGQESMDEALLGRKADDDAEDR